MRFGDPRVQALAGALCTSVLAVTGITNKSLRALMTGLLGGTDYTMSRASYDLARLARTGSSPESRAKICTGSPATGCGLRSSTPSCTTDCDVRCSPPTSRPRHHHYERPCAPSTFTSVNPSTRPACYQRQPETQDNPRSPSDRGSLAGNDDIYCRTAGLASERIDPADARCLLRVVAAVAVVALRVDRCESDRGARSASWTLKGWEPAAGQKPELSLRSSSGPDDSTWPLVRSMVQ